MGGIGAFEVDVATEAAWCRFEERLARHLAAMEDGDHLLLDTDLLDGEGEVWPYVQAMLDDEVLHLEVSGNRYLTGHHLLDATQAEALAALGFGDDGVANPAVDLDEDELDPEALAATVVEALRSVFGVLHPSLLRSEQVAVDDPIDAEGPVVVTPLGRDHLRALVDEALTTVLGHRPEHDEDDDVPVIDEHWSCWVRIHPTAPIVEVLATVVWCVGDLDAARFEVNVLNRDSLLIRHVLRGDAVLASIQLPALPFVPQHLCDLVHVLTSHVAGVAGDLAHRVGGRTAHGS